MAKRRANSEGSVRQRPDGRWEARLSYLHSDTGVRKRVSVYAGGRKAALAELDKVQDRIAEGQPPRDASRTLADWLRHWRETTLAASDRKASTKELYANLARNHLEPEPFGALRLDRLKPFDVERLILSMRVETKPGRPTEDEPDPKPVRALSDSTIRQVYTILRAALDGAVRDGLLARNPAAAVRRPGIERGEASYLPSDDVSKLLRAASGSRYYPVLALIATTGLRRGEALGLSWDKVDLDAGLLKVTATLNRVDGRLVCSEPKTQRARRTMPLTPTMVALLRKHKATQAAERLRAANQWDGNGLVFTSELGSPVDPRNILRTVEVAARKAGVEGVGVHTLRHSAAVAWLESGTHIKAVADLLGHSSIAITGDTYGHTSDGAAKAAVMALGARLGDV
jgi:integrase